MKKVSDFEKKYPLFVPYVTDEGTRANMLTNEDLLRKYNEHLGEIQKFVQEIASRFDNTTVFALLQASVFKFPDEMLLSFIKAYLNSGEAAKNNSDVIQFYNKTFHEGKECVHYIEEHGIITNRSYRDIPTFIVDEEYEKHKKGDEVFGSLRLDQEYQSLNLREKRLVVGLLKRDSFDLLNLLFASINIDFRSLLAMLSAKEIDAEILNKEVVEGIGEYNLLLLLFAIFEIEHFEAMIDNIHYLIKQARFELLKKLTTTKNVASLNEYSSDAIESMSDDELIEEIMKKNYNLLKKDE